MEKSTQALPSGSDDYWLICKRKVKENMQSEMAAFGGIACGDECGDWDYQSRAQRVTNKRVPAKNWPKQVKGRGA